MGTRWYAYDRSGSPSGPYFDTKAEARDACGEGEVPRPIQAGLSETPDDSTADDLDELSHEELKAEAERRGIDDEIDLRSKASIRDGLRDHSG